MVPNASNSCGNTLQYTHNQYIMVYPHKCHVCSMAYKLDAMFGHVVPLTCNVLRKNSHTHQTHMVAVH